MIPKMTEDVIDTTDDRRGIIDTRCVTRNVAHTEFDNNCGDNTKDDTGMWMTPNTMQSYRLSPLVELTVSETIV